MPAWITSQLRAETPMPISPSASRIKVSMPAIATRPGQARPTTPAPITTASISACSMRSMPDVARDIETGGDDDHDADQRHRAQDVAPEQPAIEAGPDERTVFERRHQRHGGEAESQHQQ